MKKVKKITTFIRKSSKEDFKIAVRFCSLIIRTYLLVNVLPLKFYYNKYFCTAYTKSVDLHPYRKEICLLKRIIRYSPIPITCLVEAMVIQSYFKRYEMVLPINIGVNTNNGFEAHAWINADANVVDFQMIKL